MIITCPTCATRYEAATDVFEPDGRKVRCTSCSHTWFQPPESSSLEASSNGFAPAIEDDFPSDDFDGMQDNVGDIESEAARLASASRRATAGFAESKAERIRAARGWLALAACIAVFVGGGYFFNVQVVRMFPAAAQVYAALGMEVNTRGLAFHNLTYGQDFENGVPVMAIKGEIVNVSGSEIVPPRVRFSLLNEADQEIYHWTMKVDKKPLAPDAAVPFSTRLASPPAAARNIQVRFAVASN